MANNRDIDKRAAQYKRSRTAQAIFNWASNDEATYNSIQRSVTERFCSEGHDIITAGSMLQVWVESEAAQYKEDAERDWHGANRSFREHRASVYGMISELLDLALASMTEADWQGLAADFLEEPWQSAIHRLA